jgi:hypothetical protein
MLQPQRAAELLVIFTQSSQTTRPLERGSGIISDDRYEFQMLSV